MRLLHRVPATVLPAALGGCVSSEPVAYLDAPAIQSMSIQPPQRGYLDAGPAPARPSAPSYLGDSGILPSF